MYLLFCFGIFHIVNFEKLHYLNIFDQRIVLVMKYDNCYLKHDFLSFYRTSLKEQVFFPLTSHLKLTWPQQKFI